MRENSGRCTGGSELWRVPLSEKSGVKLIRHPRRKIVDGVARRRLLHEFTGKYVDVAGEHGNVPVRCPDHGQRGRAANVTRATWAGRTNQRAAQSIDAVSDAFAPEEVPVSGQ